MESWFRRVFLICLGALAFPAWCFAEEATETPEVEPSTPLIEPFIIRRDLEEAQIRARDIEASLYMGQYSVEDFGVSDVLGVTLAYHISEGLFVEAIYGQSEIQNSSAEVLGGFDLYDDDNLHYYNVSVGYHIMPGESFVWRNNAFNSAVYFIGGFGVTEFAGENKSTLNVGAGFRFVLWDWLAFRLDMRNHFFRHDLFVNEKLVNNFETRAGISVFF